MGVAGTGLGAGQPARVLRSILAGTAAWSALTSTALAQSVAPTREEVTRRDAQPTPPPATRLEVEGGIERAPCALDNPQFKDIRFVLRDVAFEGLKGVPAEELRGTYAGLVGQEHPVSILCDIRDRAATVLREAGYIAAVEVPEQRIADGNVRFRVLMAKLVQVRVRGNAGRAERTIAGYLSRLEGQDVFNRFEAERYLLLASDIPGYNVRLALRPAGTVPGEVIGEVTVLRMPVLIDFNAQNYGSHELGRWGGLLRGQFFGLTGLGDRTTLAVYSTFDPEEQQTLQVGHDFRVGSEGMTVSGLFTYAWARPDLPGDDSDVDARTLYATAEVGYPFLRSQARSVRGAVGFDFVNQDVEIDDLDLSRDRLRVAFARMTWDAVSMNYSRATAAEPLWRALGSLEVRRGLDIFGATDGCGEGIGDCFDDDEVATSRIEGDATATVLRGSIYGEYRPAPKVTLALGLLGQYSNDALLSFEEFSAGNFTAGRGYDPGVLQGDRGFGLQAEIRAGSQVPSSVVAIAAEPYAFFDYATVGNEDRLLDIDGSRDLSSIGAGVRATWGDKMRFDVALAVPLEKAGFPADKPDVRLLISISTRLLPWSFK